jgi:hypothetical protein
LRNALCAPHWKSFRGTNLRDVANRIGELTMPNPKLTAIITALMFVANSNGANAAYNLTQLQEIERYIVSKDCGALLDYLQSNPGIMDGSDLLSQELRSFADGVEGGLIQCFSTQDVTRNSGSGPQRIY